MGIRLLDSGLRRHRRPGWVRAWHRRRTRVGRSPSPPSTLVQAAFAAVCASWPGISNFSPFSSERFTALWHPIDPRGAAAGLRGIAGLGERSAVGWAAVCSRDRHHAQTSTHQRRPQSDGLTFSEVRVRCHWAGRLKEAPSPVVQPDWRQAAVRATVNEPATGATSRRPAATESSAE
jgi:hypothetical protein